VEENANKLHFNRL